MAINRIVRVLVRGFWAVVILSVLAAAAYQSLGRMMMPRLSQYHQGIEAKISEALNVPVSVASISGDWQRFQPVVRLNQIYINSPSATPIVIRRLHLQLNVFASLMARKPVFTKLIIDGARVHAARTDTQGWQLAGLSMQGDTTSMTAATLSVQTLLELVQSQRRVEINDSVVNFRDVTQEQSIRIDEWSFQCIDETCAMRGEVTLIADEPATLQFSGNAQNLSNSARFDLEAYLELEPLRLESWLPLLDVDTPVDLSFERFQLGGRVWLQWQQGRPKDIRGSLYAPDLKLVPGGKSLQPLEYISTDFVWQYQPGNNNELWALWLNDFSFQWQGEVFEPAQQRWAMLQEGAQRKVKVVADALDLEFTNNTLLAIEQLPDKLRQVLDTLKPEGRLINAQVTYGLPGREDPGAPLDVLVEANLYNVGVSAWMNAPSLRGLDGYLLVKPQSGFVEFESQDLDLHFPKLYSNAMEFDVARGAIHWNNRGEALWMHSDLITLEGRTGTVMGEFLVESPRDGAEPRIEMLLALHDAPLAEALSLVPDKRIDAQLNYWLGESIESGIAREGYFLLSGSLRRGAPQSAHHMQLKLGVSDATLAFHPEWPAITQLDAQLDINQTTAEIRNATGQLLNLDLPEMSADWVASGGRGALRVSASVEGTASDGLRLLTDTPIRAGLFDLIDDFEANGNLGAVINLHIPIADVEQTEVDLLLNAEQVGLSIDSLDLQFKEITGEFSYHTHQGIFGETSSAFLFGEPIAVTLRSSPLEPESSHDSGGHDRTAPFKSQLQIQGHIGAHSLREWQQLSLLEPLAGGADYTAQLFMGGAEPPRLSIISSLEGLKIQAPEPLSKAAETPAEFAYIMELGQNVVHRMRYAGFIDTALVLNNSDFTQGEIRLGGGRAYLEESPGINLRGTIDSLDLLAWRDFLANLGAPAARSQSILATEDTREELPVDPQTAGFMARMKAIELTFGELRVDEQILSNLNLQMEQIGGDWWAQIENEILKGNVRFFADPSDPVKVELEFLRLPSDSDGNTDPLLTLQPQQVSPFDFSVAQLTLGEKHYGQWAFNYRTSESGAHLEELSAEVKGIEIDGELLWDHGNGGHQSRFMGRAQSKDVKKTMDAMGYPNTLEAKDLTIEGELNWSGSPAAVDLQKLVGPLSLSAAEGRFIDLESAPAALKILGLFNLSSVARRIRLDFSDITKSGYSFDSIEGALFFDSGKVSTTDSLLINGPSAKFKLDGTTDLINQQLDQNLLVVLPLSDNIPIAATVLGAPQVGIPLWLLNKAFGNMFETFSSAEYKITGTLSEPSVESIRRYEKRMSETPSTDSGSGT